MISCLTEVSEGAGLTINPEKTHLMIDKHEGDIDVGGLKLKMSHRSFTSRTT